jgi:RNA polymerase sigma-70 factor (ECF subfamily)
MYSKGVILTENIDNKDFVLVKNSINGDEESFKKLTDKYIKKVFNLAYRYLGNHQDAEDITQEVFINLYNNLKKYNPEYKFSTWLFKIAVNQSLYQYRSKKNRNSKKTDITALFISENSNLDSNGASCDPENKTLEKEMSLKIIDALNCIDEKYRMILIYRHYLDFSYEEIQAVTGIPLGTVKTNLFRARKKLKDILEEDKYFSNLKK